MIDPGNTHASVIAKACTLGRTDVVKMLIAREDTIVNLQDEHGLTALIRAVQKARVIFKSFKKQFSNQNLTLKNDIIF